MRCTVGASLNEIVSSHDVDLVPSRILNIIRVRNSPGEEEAEYLHLGHYCFTSRVVQTHLNLLAV